ncbi:MAG: NAD(P)-dependent oxidoreductase [Acidobacteriota bacterium]|nr:NAD(P)-dependent oxidoreductase [Acidobacteriota bacterium]
MQENLKIRPLIIGAGGLVGRTLVSRLEPRFPHTVSATRAEIDICDRWGMAAEIARLRPTVVLNCAAMSNVDACEEDPEAADRVNAEGPAHLAEICRREGIRLIHFSTDYVFDGEKQGEYDEADAPGPVNHYGWSKLRGEQAVLETLVEAVVLRVSFVFGSGRPTFLDKIADQLRQGDGAVRVFEGVGQSAHLHPGDRPGGGAHPRVGSDGGLAPGQSARRLSRRLRPRTGARAGRRPGTGGGNRSRRRGTAGAASVPYPAGHLAPRASPGLEAPGLAGMGRGIPGSGGW